MDTNCTPTKKVRKDISDNELIFVRRLLSILIHGHNNGKISSNILAVKYISGDGDESCGSGHSDKENCNNKGINNSIGKKCLLECITVIIR